MNRIARYIFLIVLCLALFGCVSTSPTSTRYYLLDTVTKREDVIKTPAFNVGVGPIVLSSYLKQEGIAIHKASNVIEYSEDHLWAEPLERNISQVLLSNLNTLLVNQTVYSFPWKVLQKPDYQIVISINRFGWFPENQVAIRAQVRIESADAKIVYSGAQDLSLTSLDERYESNIAAQNLLLYQFSVQVAKKLSNVVEKSES